MVEFTCYISILGFHGTWDTKFDKCHQNVSKLAMYYQMKNSIKHEENLIREKKNDNKGNLR